MLSQRFKGSWKKPGQGVKEAEEIKDDILEEVLYQALSCSSAQVQIIPPSLSCLQARRLAFLFSHHKVTSTDDLGDEAQGPKLLGLSFRTGNISGAQIGALEGTVVGVGTQRPVNCNVMAEGHSKGTTVSSKALPFPLGTQNN